MDDIRDKIFVMMQLFGPVWIEEILEKGYFYLGSDIKIQIYTQPFIPRGQIYLMDLKAGAFSYGVPEYDYCVVLGSGPKIEEAMVKEAFK